MDRMEAKVRGLFDNLWALNSSGSKLIKRKCLTEKPSWMKRVKHQSINGLLVVGDFLIANQLLRVD